MQTENSTWCPGRAPSALLFLVRTLDSMQSLLRPRTTAVQEFLVFLFPSSYFNFHNSLGLGDNRQGAEEGKIGASHSAGSCPKSLSFYIQGPAQLGTTVRGAASLTPRRNSAFPINRPCPFGHDCPKGALHPEPCPLGTMRSKPGEALPRASPTPSCGPLLFPNLPQSLGPDTNSTAGASVGQGFWGSHCGGVFGAHTLSNAGLCPQTPAVLLGNPRQRHLEGVPGQQLLHSRHVVPRLYSGSGLQQ